MQNKSGNLTFKFFHLIILEGAKGVSKQCIRRLREWVTQCKSSKCEADKCV